MNIDKNNLGLIYEASIAQQRALMKEIQKRKLEGKPPLTDNEKNDILNPKLPEATLDVVPGDLITVFSIIPSNLVSDSDKTQLNIPLRILHHNLSQIDIDNFKHYDRHEIRSLFDSVTKPYATELFKCFGGYNIQWDRHGMGYHYINDEILFMVVHVDMLKEDKSHHKMCCIFCGINHPGLEGSLIGRLKKENHDNGFYNV